MIHTFPHPKTPWVEIDLIYVTDEDWIYQKWTIWFEKPNTLIFSKISNYTPDGSSSNHIDKLVILSKVLLDTSTKKCMGILKKHGASGTKPSHASGGVTVLISSKGKQNSQTVLLTKGTTLLRTNPTVYSILTYLSKTLAFLSSPWKVQAVTHQIPSQPWTWHQEYLLQHAPYDQIQQSAPHPIAY
jgi:hypothetical protein